MEPPIKLEIRALSAFSPNEQSYIDRWASQIFAGQDEGYTWAKSDWRVLIWEGAELASSVEIIQRTGKVGELEVRLGGIGGVATWPAFRQRGLAKRGMQAAMDFIRDDLGVEYGLLICGRHMISYYQRLGWQVIEGRMVFDQPGRKVDYSGVTMVWPCQGKPWPDGVIDLCGLPW